MAAVSLRVVDICGRFRMVLDSRRRQFLSQQRLVLQRLPSGSGSARPRWMGGAHASSRPGGRGGVVCTDCEGRNHWEPAAHDSRWTRGTELPQRGSDDTIFARYRSCVERAESRRNSVRTLYREEECFDAGRNCGWQSCYLQPVRRTQRPAFRTRLRATGACSISGRCGLWHGRWLWRRCWDGCWTRNGYLARDRARWRTLHGR